MNRQTQRESKGGNLDLCQYPTDLKVVPIVVWYLREPKRRSQQGPIFTRHVSDRVMLT